MNEAESLLQTIELMSKQIQLELLKNNIKWEDEEVQYFIPVALHFTNFDWLELIAEHNLIEEDEKIVKNFLARVKSLKEVNEGELTEEVSKKMRRFFI